MKNFEDWWNSVSKKIHKTKMFDPYDTSFVYKLCEQAWDTAKQPPNQEVTDSQAWVCPGPESCEIAICLGCGNWCSDYPPATEL